MTTIDQTALGRLDAEGRLLNNVLKGPTKKAGRFGFRGDLALKFQAKLADEAGVARVTALEDVVPILFRHTVYKSYPVSLLEKSRSPLKNNSTAAELPGPCPR